MTFSLMFRNAGPQRYVNERCKRQRIYRRTPNIGAFTVLSLLPPSPFSLPVGIPSYICNINMTLYIVYGYCIPIKEDLTYSFIPAASMGSCYFHHKENSSMPSQHNLHSFEACTQHHNAHRKGQSFYCNGMMCWC